MMMSSSSWIPHRRFGRAWGSVVAAGLVVAVLAALGAGPVAAEQAGSAGRRVAAASIDAGGQHTCVVVATGALRCWGADAAGQLGHDTVVTVGDGTVPIKAAGDILLGGKAVAVAAGIEHTCALLTTQAVRCWGNGGGGRLGYDNTSNVSDGSGLSIQVAGDVPLGFAAKAVAITAGHDHTCALLTTGAVRCWGQGPFGQLGHDSTFNIGDGVAGHQSIEAAGDVPLSGNVTAITTGDAHTCALMTTGGVRCWGSSADGRLGYGATPNIGDGDPLGIPIETLGDLPLSGKATAITAGYDHTCALMTTGGVRCWGAGHDGQLGYGNTANIGDGTGVLIQDLGDVLLGGKATAISAGGNHTCALLTTGAVRCWGEGAYGELGYGGLQNVGDGTGPSIEAAGDVRLGGKAVAISAGDTHTCALMTTGAVRCWGNGFSGQLGHGNKQNIGDGFGPSIETAGDVPVGVPVRVRAATTVTAKRTPSRDRRAPYVYAITGQVSGPFVADGATCTGRVRITVLRHTKTLEVRTPRLDSRCRYHARIRLGGHKLHVHSATRLKAQVHFLGTGNLQPARISRRVTAH